MSAHPDTHMSVPASDLVRDAVLEICLSGVRRFAFRLWLAAKVFAIGALIAGFAGCEIVDVELKQREGDS